MHADLHPTTVIALDPESRQRCLIAEVHPELDGGASEQALKAFQARLFERNVRVGLVFTRGSTYVIRDLLKSMRLADNSFDVVEIDTSLLLEAASLGTPKRGDAFSQQVLTWLAAVAGSWSSFLPSQALPAMVPEVVGNLAEAHFEQWNNVLEADDAA